MPSRRGVFRLLAFALVGLPAAAAYVVSGLTRPINFHDEGFPVYAALRILNGEVPYRDFWAIHPPGQWYTLAAVFKLFGPSLLVERIWDALLRVAILFALFALTSRMTSPRIALVPGTVIGLWLGATPFYAYMMFPALLLSALSGVFLLNYLAGSRARWVFLSGLAVGLTAVYRHDVAFYAGASGGLVLAGRAFARASRDPAGGRVAGLTGAVKILGLYAGGILAATVPVVVALLSVVPAGELWSLLIVYPFRLASAVRSLPLPPPLPNPLTALQGRVFFEAYLTLILESWIPFYFPVIACLIGAAASLVFLARVGGPEPRQVTGWGTVWLTLFGALLFLQALSRADAIHLLPTSLIAIVLLTVLASWGWRALGRTSMLAIMCFCLPLLSVSLLWTPSVETLARVYARWPPNCSLPFERARCLPLHQDQGRAILIVQRLVPPGERIFVGHRRHDLIFVTDVLFYFVAGRDSATRYFSLEPGVATTEAVQQEIVQELERHRVRVIVLYSPTNPIVEPNESGRSSGVSVLDDYIRATYGSAWAAEEYSIWTRR
jgi:hypothetical protein